MTITLKMIFLRQPETMAKKYKCHASHNQVLGQYAMNIFDSTRRFHGLGDRERLLLQIAVTLHACGKFISMKTPMNVAIR